MNNEIGSAIKNKCLTVLIKKGQHLVLIFFFTDISCKNTSEIDFPMRALGMPIILRTRKKYPLIDSPNNFGNNIKGNSKAAVSDNAAGALCLGKS